MPRREWTYWPCNLDLWTPKLLPLLGYPKIIPYTKFEHLGSFVFELCCGQTDKQTDSKILPTPTDIVCVGNNLHSVQISASSLGICRLLRQPKMISDEQIIKLSCTQSRQFNAVQTMTVSVRGIITDMTYNVFVGTSINQSVSISTTSIQQWRSPRFLSGW